MAVTQQKVSLYQMHLAAEWLLKKVLKAHPAGVGQRERDDITIRVSRRWSPDMVEREPEASYLRPLVINPVLYSLKAEQREEFAANLLEITGAQIVRQDGRISLVGYAPGLLKIPWSVSVGQGVCEQVKVGTRVVKKPAEGTVYVDVEEDVFEYRCVDPLADLAQQ